MPRPIRILKLPAVEDKSGLKRDSIYRGAREGWFPRPVKISQWASGWIEEEIDAYLANRRAERDVLFPATAAKANNQPTYFGPGRVR